MANQRDPYQAKDDPEHPGVQGKPFNDPGPPDPQTVGQVAAGQKVDPTGTGTLSTEQQGTEGRAQPAGLSAATQYGMPTANEPQGQSPKANPVTHPDPELEGDEEEDQQDQDVNQDQDQNQDQEEIDRASS